MIGIQISVILFPGVIFSLISCFRYVLGDGVVRVMNFICRDGNGDDENDSRILVELI